MATTAKRPKKIQRKAIIVLGMHRSGTSALARVLSLCGATLPKNIMQPAADNELGFWEPEEIVRIHDEILESAGSSWDDVCGLSRAWFDSDFVEYYAEKLVDAVTEDYEDSPLIILKDPRVCLLVPLWLRILEKLDIKPYFVFCVRNPLEIASSLKHRNDFPKAKSLLLWLQYIITAEKDTRSHPRTFVKYDDLIGDANVIVKKISRDLSIRFPNTSNIASLDVEKSVKQQQRHHQSKDEMLLEDADILDWLKQVYQWETDASHGKPVSTTVLDQVYEALAKAEKAFGPVITETQSALRICQGNESKYSLETAQQSNTLSLISADLARLNTENSKLTDEVLYHHKVIADLTFKIATIIGIDAQAYVNQHDVVVSWENIVNKLYDFVNEKNTFVLNIQDELVKSGIEKERIVNELNEKILLLNSEHKSYTDVLHKQITAYDGELARTKNVVSELQQTIIAKQNELLNRQYDLLHKQSQVEELKTQLYYKDNAINQFINSTSWRITKPIRGFKRFFGSSSLVSSVKSGIGKLARKVYRRLPLTYTHKQTLKNIAYRNFDFLIKNTASYKHWKNHHHSGSDITPIHTDYTLAQPVIRFDSTLPARPPGSYQAYDWSDYLVTKQFLADSQTASQNSSGRKEYPLIDINEQDYTSIVGKLRFKQVKKPLVSIVIPVYNNIKFTLECLCSISRNTRNIAYEIILVDDGSSDATETICTAIANVKYLKNPCNLGFVRTCNNGAEVARGQYILFLNNDVQVTEGWLGSLVKTFDDFEKVGAVGPQMLYPNGLLQEAGAYLDRNATSSLIGVGGDPLQANYNYIRRVDYCSGACLILETELFRKLGGFDDNLAPAYCEDVDLCLQIRDAGYHIYYNPESVILHHLSITSDSINKQYKLDCVIRNQDKLSQKWQQKLDEWNKVRLIAFYLPQFHPIPENNRWWGEGFTEWTNVSKARPNYTGHYQPHLPADLGFYDLRVEDVMVRQAQLARRYGIYGFCYFYYWFGGKRLLEMPIERMLLSGKPDMPFCLSWANENWTRRWDGMEKEVLMAQQHSDADDLAFIRDVIRYFKHPHYIRIYSKPLLLIYRVNLFPNILRSTEIWREECRRAGIGDIYLAMVESFEHAAAFEHPGKYGFDASVEYPPHGMGAPLDIPGTLLNPDYTGLVNDYREMVRKYLTRGQPGYIRFRGVMPSWDNTARRQNHSVVVENSSPGAYQAWLEATIQQTREQNVGEERIVFINAWNEWAEGAHLEPDKRYGHAYLEATRNSLDAWLLQH